MDQATKKEVQNMVANFLLTKLAPSPDSEKKRLAAFETVTEVINNALSKISLSELGGCTFAVK